jgi:hypothetical protein
LSKLPLNIFSRRMDPPGIYQCGHAATEEFRDRELGVKAAEGFVRMTGQKNGDLIISGRNESAH